MAPDPVGGRRSAPVGEDLLVQVRVGLRQCSHFWSGGHVDERLVHLVDPASLHLVAPTGHVSPPYDSGLVNLPLTSGAPSLSSEKALIEVVRHVVGSRTVVRVNHWHVRRENYVVASVATQQPALRLIVKLEVTGERPNRHLDAMAAIARLVRSQTSVPTFDVVAVDTTRQQWPWEYLVVTELAGLTWMELYPRLQGAGRAAAQRQIGRAAGQLHSLRFESFGQIGPD